MNTIYRIVWNAATGKWVVASELAKGRKKKSAAKIAVLALALAGLGAPVAFAAETDAQEKTEEVDEDKNNVITPFYAVGGGDDNGRADNVAIGSGAATRSSSSVAIGHDAVANNVANVAIGWGANTTGSNAISMGYNATANGNYSMSLGGGSSATAARTTAVGTDTVASGSNATAVGNASKAATTNSAAFGNGARAGLDANDAPTGSGQTALGASAKAIGAGGTAVGLNTTAAGNDSFAGATNASSIGNWSVAVGRDSVANADRSVALGSQAVAGVEGGTGGYQTALGNQAQALADRAIAVGSAAVVAAEAVNGVAIGRQSIVAAAATNSVALGAGSAATRANTVSVGTTAAGGQRQIVNVAAGTANTDAVNVSQLKGTAESIADIIGGGSTVGADGTISAPSYRVGGTTVNTMGDAISNIDGRVTQNAGNITNLQATVADAVMYDSAAHNSVTLGGTSATAPVALKNIANGALTATSTDAVNGSQLFATNQRVTGAETNITNLNGRVTTNEGDIVDIRNQLGNGSIGLVQQDEDTGDITVAAGTGGGRVSFAGTDGARTLAGVAAGTLSATSTEAVNGSQLFATNQRVTSAETNITNLNGRVTTNEGDIVDIRNQLGNGSVGLVQQAGARAGVTVAAATGGTSVNFTGTDGTRQLKGVSKGEDATDAVNVAQLRDELASVSAGDTRYFKANGANNGTDDAIATGDKAVAIGANAKTGGAGAVALGSDAEAKFAGSVAVGDGAVATYSNAVAIGAQSSAASSTAVALGTSAKARNANDTAIGSGAQASLNSTSVGQGTTAVNGSAAVGQGAMALGTNSVALGSGSFANRANSVSVGSVGSERQIVNVADGTEDTDAVNVRQLKSAGLVGDDGSLMDAVVYDAGSNRSSITLGGVAGTTITNVMAGLVAPGSMDAINGSQLWGVQDQINKLGDRVVTIENGAVSPGPAPADPIQPGNGNPHFASSGDAGKPATATGSSSVAAGEGAKASGNSSTAIGAGSSATGNNSVAIGAGSVADGDNTVSVGSVGNERRISNVATGTQRTDAANVGQLQDAMSNLQDWTQGQVNGLSKKVDNVQRQANRGIAASAALVNNMPYLPGKVTLNAGVAAYRGQSALGVGMSRWNDSGRFNVNAGISAARGDAPIFRVGVGVVLGD